MTVATTGCRQTVVGGLGHAVDVGGRRVAGDRAATLLGAVHVSATAAFEAVAVTPVGAPGIVSIEAWPICTIDATDGVPWAFITKSVL